ncbi:MAG: myxosortase MrtX [Myxococcaceae bacterium]
MPPPVAEKHLSPVREVLTAWSIAFGVLLIAFLVARPWAKVLATVAFLYVPLWFLRRRGEDAGDYGLTFRHWRKDLAVAAKVLAVVTPLFILVFWAFVQAIQWAPSSWRAMLTPLNLEPHFAFRLPARFPEWVLDQLFVVALPEEFFYRGYMQTRLRTAWPDGRSFLGVRWGRAFWVTALLFALGHLAIFQVWRLAVFFPALLFGWVRERTGTVLGATLVHAGCNLLEMVLEASFFGPR